MTVMIVAAFLLFIRSIPDKVLLCDVMLCHSEFIQGLGRAVFCECGLFSGYHMNIYDASRKRMQLVLLLYANTSKHRLYK